MITLSAEITVSTNGFSLGNTPLGTSSFVEGKIDKAIDFRSLISLNSSIVDRGDINLPSWGIISNGGRLSFKDSNGAFKHYAQLGNLKSGNKVRIFLNNTLSKTRTQVGEYIAKDWNYDTDNRQVELSVQDDLEEWQDLTAIGRLAIMAFPEFIRMGLGWYYNHLAEQTPEKYNLLTFDELDEQTQDILKSTPQRFKIAYTSSLWSCWNKLCEATGCYIYKSFDGKTIFKYGRGV